MFMDFPLGADVHCTDGRCGRSTHIVLNPAIEEITHLVVRGTRPARIERLVPVRLVASTAADAILLKCTLQEFAALERFNQPDFVYREIPHHATDPKLTLLWPYVVPAKRIVDEKIRPMSPGELPVRRGARVRATDGWIGQVDEFVVEPKTCRITHLVLRERHLWKNKVLTIPISEIDRIEEKAVYLKIGKRDIEALQPIPIDRVW
jgi:sporulation protein YlmC with PRC-barrel domain